MKSAGDILGNGSSYREKLNSNQWKAFAKGVRSERGNACQICKRGGLVLQVHHWFYDGREPWEYERDEVILLCEFCHKQFHDRLKEFRHFVFSKMTPQSLKVLNGALLVGFDQYDPLVFAHAIAKFVSTPRMIERFAAAWDCKIAKGGQ